jgi:hypothetical protein
MARFRHAYLSRVTLIQAEGKTRKYSLEGVIFVTFNFVKGDLR